MAIGEINPATLFVQMYFKYSSIPAVPHKLSVTLCYRNHRILAIDDNGPSRHFNAVGVGRPFFQRYVDHPQLHTLSDDAIDGYAAPIAAAEPDAHWLDFCLRANIVGAPPFRYPPAQMEMLI